MILRIVCPVKRYLQNINKKIAWKFHTLARPMLYRVKFQAKFMPKLNFAQSFSTAEVAHFGRFFEELFPCKTHAASVEDSFFSMFIFGFLFHFFGTLSNAPTADENTDSISAHVCGLFVFNSVFIFSTTLTN